MTQLVVDNNQATSILRATDGVEIVDAQGRVLGYVMRPFFTAKELRDTEKAILENGPRYTTQQVLNHLNSLSPE